MPIRVEHVRARAVRAFPFLTKMLLSMTPVATDEKLPRQFVADDEWHFYYNPGVLGAIDLDTESGEVALDHNAFTMCTEAARLLQSHAERLRPFIPDKDSGQDYVQAVAEIVSTAIANELIGRTGELRSPDRTVRLKHIPVEFKGLGVPSVEDVIREILTNYPPPPTPPGAPQGGESDGENESAKNQEPSQQPGGSSQGSGTGQGSPPPPQGSKPQRKQHAPREQTSPENLAKALQDRNLTTKNQKLPNCHSGSSVDGIRRPWESHKQKTDSRGQEQPGSLTNAPAPRREAVQGQVKRDVALCVRNGKGCGDGDSDVHGWKQWAEDQLGAPQRVTRDMYSLLRQWSETIGGCHIRRYDGRNRRQQQMSQVNQMTMVMPSERSPKIDCVFVLDDSGSMDSDSLRLGVLYIAATLESLNIDASARLYVGNTTPVLACERLTPTIARSLEFQGCGGTNMGTVCKMVLQMEHDKGRAPNVMMCLTDGYTPWPDEAYSVPFAITLVPDIGANMNSQDYMSHLVSTYAPPEWAEVVWIDFPTARQMLGMPSEE